jgi:hypothetical protein
MKKWFCNNKEGLGTFASLAVCEAGYWVTKNNKGYVSERVLPVIEDVEKRLSEENPVESVISAAIYAGINELLETVKDPIATSALVAAISAIKIDPKTAAILIGIELAKDMISAFKEGMKIANKEG